MNIKRGDIYWIEQSKYRPAVGHMQNPGRPGIVVSNDANNACAYTLEIVYLTTSPKKDLPTHCTITSAKTPSTALCEQVTTISNEQIREYIGTCTAEEMAQVDRCIAASLAIKTWEDHLREIASEAPVASHFENDDLLGTIHDLEMELAAANAKLELMQEMYSELMERTIG